jgi:glycosyltransferase involved in cell wall biosynthesis
MFAINTRILRYPLTGVQRYLSELMARFDRDDFIQLGPKRHALDMMGHLWEQCVLPTKLHGHLLFSPSNSGPLTVHNQVVTIHDVAPLDHPEWVMPAFAAGYQFLVPRLARRIKHIITISAFTQSRIIETIGIPERKITVIPNGVDARFRPQSASTIDAMLKDLNLPSRHYLLSLGSLEPRKNLARLLAIWSKIQKQLPDDLWLVVAGEKGHAGVFQEIKLDRQLPRVHYTRYVADSYLPALYAGAMAFIYLSVYEGFGLPPLEAMAAGTPVLTGNSTALPEVVGDAGIMVNPYDEDAIAQGIIDLIQSTELQSALKEQGLKRSALFRWENTAMATLKLLRDHSQ